MEGNFQSSFSRIEGLASSFSKGLLQGIAGGLSVAGVTAFGREILNLADNLQNLSEQTGLTVELLSGIKSPLEEAGTSVDAFAKGVFNLQKNLGNIDKETDPAAQAIKRLGLNLDELRNATPDEFIKKVTDALGQIENPLERNTVMFNLLGKSAKELGPALAALAGRFDELKRSGLSAADVKALDDVGDALTRLRNQALLLGAEGVAGILRFFGALRDVPKVGSQLEDAAKKFSQLSGIPKARVEGMTSKEIIAAGEKPGFGINPQALRMARDDLLNLREEFDKLNQVNVVKPQAVFKGISQGAKTAQTDVKNLADTFLDALEKQLGTLEGKKIELAFGPDVALGASLDRQFEDFKEKLREKNIPLPKGIAEFFANLRDRIVESSRAVRELDDSLDESTKRQQAFADAANEGVGIQFLNREDVARQFQELQRLTEAFKTLKKEMAIDILPEDQRAAARAGQEFEERIDVINRWRDAAIAAGQDVAQVNAEAAQATADAWVTSFDKLKDKTEEISEFTRTAFERGFGAVSDAIESFLNGEVKSFDDFAKTIQRTLNSLLADQFTRVLKDLFLGEDFGKKGVPIGGWLGGLLGGTKQETRQLPGTTAADTLDQERGQEMRDAAAAAMQTSTATAEATIQALQAQATATLQAQSAASDAELQAMVVTGQTAIESTGATAAAGIDAVQAAAIAAIQAAAAGGAGGGGAGGTAGGLLGLFGGLFGGGGAGADAGLMWVHGGGAISDLADYRAQRGYMLKMHSGGEVPIMAQRGEFMISRPSAERLGLARLNYMNRTGTIPQDLTAQSASSSGDHYVFQFNGVTDVDSFRRSRSQLLADLTRAVQKGQRHI